MKQLHMGLAIVVAAAYGAPALAAETPVIRLGWSVPAQTQHYVMMKKPELLKNLGKSYQIELPSQSSRRSHRKISTPVVSLSSRSRARLSRKRLICASWLISRASGLAAFRPPG
jgi:hypothetical protein